MTPDIAAAAQSSTLLGRLPKDAFDRMMDCATRREYSNGETIFLQGEPATAIFMVIQGAVKLFRISPGGAEAVVTILGESRSFGEAVALRKGSYPVSAAAIADTSLLQIDGARLRRQILEDPNLGLNLLTSSYVHLQGLVEQIEQLKARSGVQRLAEFLIELAAGEDVGPSDTTTKLTLPYNKTLIAGQLGLQPESLSRAFARLREFGVRIDGYYAQIDDLDRLREIAQQDKGQPWMR